MSAKDINNAAKMTAMSITLADACHQLVVNAPSWAPKEDKDFLADLERRLIILADLFAEVGINAEIAMNERRNGRN